MTIQRYNPNARETAIASRFEYAMPKPQQTRLKPRERGYLSQWYKIRRQHLQASPACVCCGRPAQEVHHRIHDINDPSRNDHENLDSLCILCHHKITAKESLQNKPLMQNRA